MGRGNQHLFIGLGHERSESIMDPISPRIFNMQNALYTHNATITGVFIGTAYLARSSFQKTIDVTNQGPNKVMDFLHCLNRFWMLGCLSNNGIRITMKKPCSNQTINQTIIFGGTLTNVLPRNNHVRITHCRTRDETFSRLKRFNLKTK